MQEMARTALRLPWEMARFGLEQFESLLAADNRDSLLARTRQNLDAALRAAEAGFDGAVFEAVQALESMPETALLDGGSAKAGADWTRQAVAWLEDLTPGEDGRLALREFGNRLQSFSTFRFVDAALGIGPGDTRPLGEWIARARELDDYTAVWAIEGLGHWWAERRPSPDGAGLLADESDLPDDALIALHAGTGLSLARQALEPAAADPAALGAALDDFRRRCERAARPGYVDVALEALGLVGRTLYPGLVPAIDQILQASDARLLALFWHGMGRGSYFLPSHFLPGDPGAARALRLLESEAPHETARANALAGLAWPLTLVNIRHPEIVEAALGKNPALAGGAFADGIGAALLAWRDLTGTEAYNRLWLAHEPDAGDRDRVQAWDECVVGPCRQATDCYAAVKEKKAFGGLFRRLSLAEVAGQPPAG